MKIVVLFCVILGVHLTVAQSPCTDTCAWYIPNSITPDCDGIDCDKLNIQTDCQLDQFQLQVFNRWGTIVFHTTEIKDCFRGRTIIKNEEQMLPQGTYTYFINFTTAHCPHQQKTGNVLLLR